MEGFIDTLFSRDILGWAIVLVMVFLLLRLLQAAGKTFLIVAAMFALGYVLYQFFPDVARPIVEFFGGFREGE